MTTSDLESALNQLEASDDWRVVFPAIASSVSPRMAMGYLWV